MILALPWLPVVITPACEPVNDLACAPNESIAMATRALEIRSPAVSSMSISRAGGAGATCLARSSSSSVVSPIAETTTTTSLPAFLVSTISWATRRFRSASVTDDPPYFCTTSATITFQRYGLTLTKDRGSHAPGPLPVSRPQHVDLAVRARSREKSSPGCKVDGENYAGTERNVNGSAGSNRALASPA